MLNDIFKSAKMPEAWRWSTMIPLIRIRVTFKVVIIIGVLSY